MISSSIKRNYLYNLAYQLFALIAPLITVPYVSRVLGADGVGDYSFANSIVTYFALFAVFGTATYGQREISYHQDDKKARSIAFFNVAILRFTTTALAMVVYLFIIFNSSDRLLYAVLSFSILLVGIDFTWFFQGVEDFKAVSLRNIFVRFISIVLTFVLVKDAGDVWVYAAIMSVSLFAGCLIVVPLLRKYISLPKISDLSPFSDSREVLSLFIPAIAISIYSVLDKTMIGLITNSAAENGYYEQASKISKLAVSVVTSLGVVMFPRIGSYFSKNDKAAVRESMYKSYRFAWFLGFPICFGVIATAPNFVPCFFGPGYEPVISILSVMSFLTLAVGVNNATGVQYLIPTKRQNLFTLSVCIGAGINFGLNLVLIRFFGAIGAAIASVIAESGIAVVQIIMVRKELSALVILKSAVKSLAAASIMLVLLIVVGAFLTSSISSTLILVLIGVLSYGILQLCFREPMLLDTINMIKTKMKKR